MKAFATIVVVATLLAVATAGVRGGQMAGQVKREDVRVIDVETKQIILKTVGFLNKKLPSLATPESAVPQLLGKTTQVVAGTLSTFTFTIPTQNNKSYLYYSEVWDAPWEGKNHQITKACILDLAGAPQVCKPAARCNRLVLSKGTCFSDE